MTIRDYKFDIEYLLDKSFQRLSSIKPSEWGEANRIMQSDNPIAGRLSYKNSPYTREIVNRLHPDDPTKYIAVMKGAQIGFSTTVIETGIGYLISQNPCNILFLVGHEDLAKDAMDKVDKMLDACNIRHLIKSSIQKAKNNKTGDTDKVKHFPNGQLKVGHANHKVLRNISMQVGFIDDYEAMKGESKESGSLPKLIEQRFAAFNQKMKLFYISTPEIKGNSNIYTQYLLGDQRKYQIPCPCCGDFITIEWSVKANNSDDMAGIFYKVDSRNLLIPDSVGYVCQSCGGFFKDNQKDKLLNEGFWKPTTEAKREYQVSYHINALYAPSFMFGWKEYAYDYLSANPIGEPRKEGSHRTFVNLVLGEPFEAENVDIKITQLQRNIRNYDIGIIPESLSEKEGTGKIVLVTCAMDINGVVEDCRIDYEIVAWAESGSSYSIEHGSFGTFIPRENTQKNKIDREKITLEHYKENSVWQLIDKKLSQPILTDLGNKMKITLTGLDTGHYTNYAYDYIDKTNNLVYGVKGDKESKYRRYGVDVPTVKISKERNNLFIVDVNHLKDNFANYANLKYDYQNDIMQPPNFINFPLPENGKYLTQGYFEHFESEHKIFEESKDGGIAGSRWTKKPGNFQNHFFDCKIYNYAVRDIFLLLFMKEAKIARGGWEEFIQLINTK